MHWIRSLSPQGEIPPSPPKSLGNSAFPRLFFFLEWFRDLSDTQNGANGAGLCGAKAIRPMHKNECCGAGIVPIAPAASYKSEYKHKDALNDLRERPSAYSMLITEFKSKSFWW